MLGMLCWAWGPYKIWGTSSQSGADELSRRTAQRLNQADMVWCIGASNAGKPPYPLLLEN